MKVSQSQDLCECLPAQHLAVGSGRVRQMLPEHVVEGLDPSDKGQHSTQNRTAGADSSVNVTITLWAIYKSTFTSFIRAASSREALVIASTQ